MQTSHTQHYGHCLSLTIGTNWDSSLVSALETGAVNPKSLINVCEGGARNTLKGVSFSDCSLPDCPLLFLLAITECDGTQHWFPKLRRRKMCEAQRYACFIISNLKWSFFNAHLKSSQVPLTLLLSNLLTQKRDNVLFEVANGLCSDAAAPPAAAAAAALAIFPLSSATWWEGAVNIKWAFAVKWAALSKKIRKGKKKPKQEC